MSPTLRELDAQIAATDWMAHQRQVLGRAREHIVALETELAYYCGDFSDPMDDGKSRTHPGFHIAFIWHGRTLASRKLLGLPGYGPGENVMPPCPELGPINEDMLPPVNRGFAGRLVAELDKAMVSATSTELPAAPTG